MAEESDSPKPEAGAGKDDGVYTVRVEHFIPDNVDLIYSDNYIVQHTQNEFTISFSQVQQPFAFTDEEYEGLEVVRAKVMARIVIPTPKMRDLIKALVDNYKLQQEQARKVLEALNVSVPANIPTEIPGASDVEP